VSVTSGGIDKLEVYRGLGVREVWVWSEGRIVVHVLGPNGYEERTGSEVVPVIDLEVLGRFAAQADQHAALKAYRDELRSGGK
jgi:hypothetical protein